MRLIDFIERNYRHMNEVTFEVVEHIGVISTSDNGWSKEVNFVSWNGADPKVDIRDWSSDHERMSRGITLTKEQATKMVECLQNWL